ncbi:MAG: pentapeptide repeat-containing protein, partial [Jatrophihabitans sp.]
CFGLCCVAPAFTVSAEFAIDKPAGHPCPHLLADSRCDIHIELRPHGFSGCTVYDCFGAGQKISQLTFAGQDWRHAPHSAQVMFDAFAVMRQLHELLWYLTESLALPTTRPIREDVSAALQATERLTCGDAEALIGLDMDSYRQAVNVLLTEVSERARADVYPAGPDRRGADLVGAHLAGAILRGANLRGARLVGADLHDADLNRTDVTGADLRAADLRGADLTGCLFLVQAQVDAARGDGSTKLPAALRHPAHWPAI